MTRLEIVTNLVRLSGHNELVADAASNDYTDNGANYFVNAGQRWLDRQFEYKKAKTWLYKSLATGEYLVTFSKARYVSQVWAALSDGTRRQLEHRTETQYRSTYSDSLDVDSGAPLVWAPATVSLAPEHGEDDAADFATAGLLDYANIQFGDSYLVDAITVGPPVEATTTIQVLARWYSMDLADNADVSFWSVNEPNMLIRAARMVMEQELHRNKDGADAFKEDLLLDLVKLYHALVAEEVAGPPKEHRMFGRWPQE